MPFADLVVEIVQPLYDEGETLAGVLAGASLLALAAAVGLHVAKLAARAAAWHNILVAAYPAERLRYRDSLGAYLCGIGVNAVLPARPGEVLKLALIKRQAAATRYQALGSTLVVESLFDTLVGSTAIGIGITVGWTTMNAWLGSVLALVAARPAPALVIVFGALVGVLLAWRLLRERVTVVVREARRGFAIFARPGRYLRQVVSWQVLALALRLGSICCFLAAFGLRVSVQTSLVVLAIQSASNMVPFTPNGAGTQQAMLFLAFGSAATTASVIGFGAGAQLTTAAADVALALVSLALLTRSLRWRGLLRARDDGAAALSAPE